MKCKICNNSTDNKIHVAKEMMFGYKDEFEYLECNKCGCLQILEIPENLSSYYAKDYYSFKSTSHISRNPLQSFFDRQRSNYLMYGKNVIGKILSKRRAYPSGYSASSLHFFDWLKEAQVKTNYKILDVGCGSGQLLLDLKREGFKDLMGVDPFIEKDTDYGNGVRILKKTLHEMENQFDFIMLNHSFEHMTDPNSVLNRLWNLLKPNRYALIRIPVASSYSWEKYGTNWVQLDAPRHLFIYSIEGMKILAKQANFQLDKIIYDSDYFQFLGSEKYMRGIPLREDSGSFELSQDELNSYQDKAKELNSINKGDQACFYLYKSDQDRS